MISHLPFFHFPGPHSVFKLNMLKFSVRGVQQHKVPPKRKTSLESEKNIFCHYRSDNIKCSVDFDHSTTSVTAPHPHACGSAKKQNGSQTGSCLSHGKINTRFVLRRSSAIEQICSFCILTNFQKKTKWRLNRKWCVARKKQKQIRAQEVRGIPKKIFLFNFDLF